MHPHVASSWPLDLLYVWTSSIKWAGQSGHFHGGSLFLFPGPPSPPPPLPPANQFGSLSDRPPPHCLLTRFTLIPPLIGISSARGPLFACLSAVQCLILSTPWALGGFEGKWFLYPLKIVYSKSQVSLIFSFSFACLNNWQISRQFLGMART